VDMHLRGFHKIVMVLYLMHRALTYTVSMRVCDIVHNSFSARQHVAYA